MKRGTLPFRGDRPARAELAAGGALVDLARSQVLLLHHREEDRWCFPKGHVEPGETVEGAALREVEEETGLKGVGLGPELGLVVYRFYQPKKDRSVVKVVVYFLMPASVRPVRPERIFDQGRWFDIEAAAEVLEFDSDKEVLELVRHAVQKVPATPTGG